MAEAVRDKRKCLRLGTGLCPRNEWWARNNRPCDKCRAYIDKNGETGGEDERA
jgi:hypothetical protein